MEQETKNRQGMTRQHHNPIIIKKSKFVYFAMFYAFLAGIYLLLSILTAMPYEEE